MTPEMEAALKSYLEMCLNKKNIVDEVISLFKMTEEDKLATLRAYRIKAEQVWVEQQRKQFEAAIAQGDEKIAKMKGL